jgi:hypothetical protein
MEQLFTAPPQEVSPLNGVIGFGEFTSGRLKCCGPTWIQSETIWSAQIWAVSGSDAYKGTEAKRSVSLVFSPG